MPDFQPVTIKLDHPIEYGDETVAEISFSRPLRMKDLFGISARKLDEMDIEAITLIAARLSGHDREVFARMEAGDGLKVLGALAPFMPTGQATGS